MNKIVFIEGVSGVGKTTTTALLSETLQDMSYKVNCYIEGDNNNPLDPFGGMYPPKISIAEFIETHIQWWQAFMETKVEHDFIVFDGTFLQRLINADNPGYRRE